jgi:hypothetical protein
MKLCRLAEVEKSDEQTHKRAQRPIKRIKQMSELVK